MSYRFGWWMGFALFMGFILGASFFAPLRGQVVDQPPSQSQKYAQAEGEGQKKNEPFWKATTNDPIALYTLVLTIFTGILAISTSLLWFETRRLASLAASQGDAFLRAERPHVFLEIVESGIGVGSEGEIRFAGKRFRVWFVNHGRTAAFLTELKEGFEVIEGLIDVPEPMDPMKFRGRLLPAGTASAIGKPYKIATNLMTTNAIGMLAEGSWRQRRLFFHGFVRYSDTFGNHYITGFLALFSPEGNVWVLRGGDRYNYSREEDPASIPEWTQEATEAPA